MSVPNIDSLADDTLGDL